MLRHGRDRCGRSSARPPAGRGRSRRGRRRPRRREGGVAARTPVRNRSPSTCSTRTRCSTRPRGATRSSTSRPTSHRRRRRPGPPSWELHNRLRTEATANLVAAAEANGVTRFVKESITLRLPRPRRRLDHRGDPARPGVAALAPTLEGERRALAFADRSDRTRARSCCASACSTAAPATAAPTRCCGSARWRPVDDRGPPDGVPVVDPRRRRRDRGAGRARRADRHLQRRRRRTAHPAASTSPRSARRTACGGSGRSRPGCCASSPAGPRPRWCRRSGCRTATFRRTTGWAPAFPSAREGWAHEAARGTEQEERTRA